MLSESIELLGAGVYKDIPGKLTLKAFPTVTELDYVSAEAFEETMLEKIFPECIEQDINAGNLLEIDFQWICRCFRFLNYGPYFTTNVLLCDNCGTIRGEAQVDLRAVECKVLPEGFTNDIVIKKDEFVDYKQDVHIHLLTIRQALDARKDKLFQRSDGSFNSEYARICYSISSMGTQKDITPVSAKLEIEEKMSSADFQILRSVVKDLTDYGLRGGGRCTCPKCKSNNAAFIALADDRFFRPTLGDIRKGRNDRNLRGIKNTSSDQTETV